MQLIIIVNFGLGIACFITLKVSCNGMKTIYKNGLADTLKKAEAKGLIKIA